MSGDAVLEAVRLAPSLLIEDRDIDEAVPKLKAAFEEWLAR